jgi:hypothetical protein
VCKSITKEFIAEISKKIEGMDKDSSNGTMVSPIQGTGLTI